MKISWLEVSYYQEADSCAKDNLGQDISIKIEDAGAGPYIVLSTERWALNYEELDMFFTTIKDLFRMVEK